MSYIAYSLLGAIASLFERLLEIVRRRLAGLLQIISDFLRRLLDFRQFFFNDTLHPLFYILSDRLRVVDQLIAFLTHDLVFRLGAWQCKAH